MTKLIPHLWYDTQAKEAAEFYTSIIPDSKIESVVKISGTPSGDCDIVHFRLAGQEFQAISAGPYFKFTPTLSFLIACETKGEVDRLWTALSEGGQTLMPLQEYPFSKHYGWTSDRFGLNWQVMLTDRPFTQKITPTLMFVNANAGKAEEAMAFYGSLFENSGVDYVMRWEAGSPMGKEGTVQHAGFHLDGMKFACMDSSHPHEHNFNEAISFMVNCRDQAEIDHFWSKLSAVPESEQCGWLKDKYGLSWQIVPEAMQRLMEGDPATRDRVTQAFLKMKKFDVAQLELAARG